MATTMTSIGTRMVTNAAATATAIAGGATTAEVQALGRLVQFLGTPQGLSMFNAINMGCLQNGAATSDGRELLPG